nr:MAG TPA: hypothetical protein [Caudoviricetes sp.]
MCPTLPTLSAAKAKASLFPTHTISVILIYFY